MSNLAHLTPGSSSHPQTVSCPVVTLAGSIPHSGMGNEQSVTCRRQQSQCRLCQTPLKKEVPGVDNPGRKCGLGKKIIKRMVCQQRKLAGRLDLVLWK